jgi:GH25 family lysozyme M1 (1,4-beta-N-acetylmuramidase)
MLYGIDISNWQKGFSISATKPEFCIVKATEGINFVDKSCDTFVQQCIKLGIPWGYYHFARTNGGAKEARYFYSQTKNYTGNGIPVLDFEDTRNANSYIDEFVKEYHTITGIFPWVYMNSDFINNRGYGSDYVKSNCGLWLAGYPSRTTTYPAVKTCPYKHNGWTLAAWQFTDNLSIGGMHVDGDVFYGGTSAWKMYAAGGETTNGVSIDGSAYYLARRVINGEFGNGSSRKAALGERYSEVQGAVNILLSGSDTELAKDVIAGKCGNGTERKTILGSRYAAVQKKVNSLLL